MLFGPQPLYWCSRQRPEKFRLRGRHQFNNGNVFAGVGAFPGTAQYYDSSIDGAGTRSGTLTNMDPATDWVRDMGRWVLNGFEAVNLRGVIGPVVIGSTVSFSCCAWTYSTSGSSYQTAISKSSVGFSTANDWLLGHGSETSSYRFAVYDNSIRSAQSSTGFAQNQLIHLAGVYNGTLVSLFVNGSNVANTTASLSNPLGNAQPLNLGCRGGGYYVWDGMLSDNCIWSRVLSPDEIKTLADPSNVMLSLGHGDPGWIEPLDIVFPTYLPAVSTPAAAKPWLWQPSRVIGGGLL